MHKYRAKSCAVNGIKFPSLKQGARYKELLLLEKAGEIDNLTLEVSYPIVVNGQKICTYRADFVYLDVTGKWIVEDVKGILTPIYKLKKKLMKAVHGIEIKET